MHAIAPRRPWRYLAFNVALGGLACAADVGETVGSARQPPSPESPAPDAREREDERHRDGPRLEVRPDAAMAPDAAPGAPPVLVAPRLDASLARVDAGTAASMEPLAGCQDPSPLRDVRHTWIFAGQSNMRPAQQFGSFRDTVAARVSGADLAMIVSQEPGRPLSYWNEGAEGWATLRKALPTAPSPVTGLVFYQGESNTTDAAARAYEADLQAFIRRVRALVARPGLPVILVQLATGRRSDDLWALAVVREAQRRVAMADPQVAIVPALDMTIGDQVIHIDGPSSVEVGRRAGLAALRLVYGVPCATHGPRLSRASFADPTRRTVLLDFDGVTGSLRLDEGWRQGLAVARGAGVRGELAAWPDLGALPRLDRALEAPIAGEVVRPGTIAVTFAQPLGADDRVGWAMTPNATWGLARLWDLPQRGLRDASGIPALAFALAEVGPPAGAAPIPPVAPPSVTVPAFDPRAPFQIAMNAVGRTATSALGPDDEVGPQGLRQRYWNSIGDGYEPNMIDAGGRVTSVGITTGVWYQTPTTATDKTADGRMMRSFNKTKLTTISGLAPLETYDVVIYADAPSGKDATEPAKLTYRITGADTSQRVDLHEPDGDPGPRVNYDFRDYVEARPDNGHTGNYVVFRGVAADEKGRLLIDAPTKENRGEAQYSGLQIIRRAGP